MVIEDREGWVPLHAESLADVVRPRTEHVGDVDVVVEHMVVGQVLPDIQNGVTLLAMRRIKEDEPDLVVFDLGFFWAGNDLFEQLLV